MTTEEKRKDYPQLIDRIEKLCSKIDKTHVALFGDMEKAGLIERVRIMEDFYKEIKEFHRSIKRVIVNSTGTIVASIFVAMVIYVLKIH